MEEKSLFYAFYDGRYIESEGAFLLYGKLKNVWKIANEIAKKLEVNLIGIGSCIFKLESDKLIDTLDTTSDKAVRLFSVQSYKDKECLMDGDRLTKLIEDGSIDKVDNINLEYREAYVFDVDEIVKYNSGGNEY